MISRTTMARRREPVALAMAKKIPADGSPPVFYLSHRPACEWWNVARRLRIRRAVAALRAKAKAEGGNPSW